MVKICPDFTYPCLEESCISYIPNIIYTIFNSKFMEKLCTGLNVNFNSINYPVHLDIYSGFCKRYQKPVKDCEILDIISQLENEINNEPEVQLIDIKGLYV
jgi:hypothetical protein